MSQDIEYSVFITAWVFYNIIFFFKQKTAYEIKECDWSSDVCSSDLEIQKRRWLQDAGNIPLQNALYPVSDNMAI